MKIYLDTNFIRDVMEKRNNKATHLMEMLRELEDKKKVLCYTSFFLLMELSDTKKDDLFFQEAINKKWEFKTIMRERNNQCLEKHHFEKVSDYNNNLLDSNIWSPDAVHLATALSNDCNLLITSDSKFKIEADKVAKKFTKYNLKILGIEEAHKIIEDSA